MDQTYRQYKMYKRAYKSLKRGGSVSKDVPPVSHNCMVDNVKEILGKINKSPYKYDSIGDLNEKWLAQHFTERQIEDRTFCQNFLKVSESYQEIQKLVSRLDKLEKDETKFLEHSNLIELNDIKVPKFNQNLRALKNYLETKSTEPSESTGSTDVTSQTSGGDTGNDQKITPKQARKGVDYPNLETQFKGVKTLLESLDTSVKNKLLAGENNNDILDKLDQDIQNKYVVNSRIVNIYDNDSEAQDNISPDEKYILEDGTYLGDGEFLEALYDTVTVSKENGLTDKEILTLESKIRELEDGLSELKSREQQKMKGDKKKGTETGSPVSMFVHWYQSLIDQLTSKLENHNVISDQVRIIRSEYWDIDRNLPKITSEPLKKLFIIDTNDELVSYHDYVREITGIGDQLNIFGLVSSSDIETLRKSLEKIEEKFRLLQSENTEKEGVISNFSHVESEIRDDLEKLKTRLNTGRISNNPTLQKISEWFENHPIKDQDNVPSITQQVYDWHTYAPTIDTFRDAANDVETVIDRYLKKLDQHHRKLSDTSGESKPRSERIIRKELSRAKTTEEKAKLRKELENYTKVVDINSSKKTRAESEIDQVKTEFQVKLEAYVEANLEILKMKYKKLKKLCRYQMKVTASQKTKSEACVEDRDQKLSVIKDALYKLNDIKKQLRKTLTEIDQYKQDITSAFQHSRIVNDHVNIYQNPTERKGEVAKCLESCQTKKTRDTRSNREQHDEVCRENCQTYIDQEQAVRNYYIPYGQIEVRLDEFSEKLSDINEQLDDIDDNLTKNNLRYLSN